VRRAVVNVLHRDGRLSARHLEMNLFSTFSSFQIKNSL
jgi:hypothetical protein